MILLDMLQRKTRTFFFTFTISVKTENNGAYWGLIRCLSLLYSSSTIDIQFLFLLWVLT